MSANVDFKAWIAERNRILREMDVDAATKQLKDSGQQPTSRKTVEASLHKARLMLRHDAGIITEEQKAASRAWLSANGFGLPVEDRP